MKGASEICFLFLWRRKETELPRRNNETLLKCPNEGRSRLFSVVSVPAFACKLWETLPLPQILGKTKKETADFLCLYL